MANGNINDGIAINNAFVDTENSEERTLNKTKITFPVRGPSAKSIKIITSISFEFGFGFIFATSNLFIFLQVYYKKYVSNIKLCAVKKLKKKDI